MNRLVKQWGSGPAVPCNINYDFVFSLDPETFAGLQAVMNRLAAYEDTGYTPGEINELALKVATLETIEAMYDGLGDPAHLRDLIKAEKDGRLVVLSNEHTDKDGKEALRRAMCVCGTTNNAVTRYTADAIAEKLAREEAEAALKEGGTDHA